MFDAAPSGALRAVAFYLPQFHPVAENNAFWGPGFTEWRNVVQARPRFRGHEQPHLPADLGFYDLRLAETRAAQADLARQAELSGFCYYHYWFAGKRVLNAPFDAVLASGKPDFPFMLCWANENWTRAWDGGSHEILLRQDYSDADTRAHARHLTQAFADPRYIKINGRPVFAVYNTDELPCPLRWADTFRETARKEGFDPYLIRVERYLDHDQRSPEALGFDAALDFQPFSRSFRAVQRCRPPGLKDRAKTRLRNTLSRWHPLDTHYDMARFVTFDICQPAPDYTRFPGVSPSWDNSARRPKGRAIVFRNSAPQVFADWVAAKALAFQPPTNDENLFFVNAWNEWAEGNHLEPCLRHGRNWMKALADGLGLSVVPEKAIV